MTSQNNFIRHFMFFFFDSVCRFTCHERCVQRSPNSCISTYTQNKTKRKVTVRFYEKRTEMGKGLMKLTKWGMCLYLISFPNSLLYTFSTVFSRQFNCPNFLSYLLGLSFRRAFYFHFSFLPKMEKKSFELLKF